VAGGATAILCVAVTCTTYAQSCSECHSAIDARQKDSRHAQALQPIPGSRLAELLTAAPVREGAGTRFDYRLKENQLIATVHSGDQEIILPLEWAFGSGVFAYTAVGRAGNAWFEHRISWYTAPARASLTPGHPLTIASAQSALGLMQSANDIYRCFHCHATGVERTADGVDLTRIKPGIHCERCHGPGREHLRAPGTGNILNPGRLPARASVQICGECHRTPKPGDEQPMPELEDPMSIRFQPVGLMASRCFIASRKLSCLTCHDAHENARRNDSAWYTARCLACHEARSSAGSACKRTARENCLPCHMQRSTPAPYLSFTDHRIRIY
jgi:Cytochrome c554 and c-prime